MPSDAIRLSTHGPSNACASNRGGPSLRDGAGKELQTLHDMVVQHLRALKALGHEPSKEFITSLLELKLDSVTMFEWQHHSQECTNVPDCDNLLEFLDLRAQAA